MVIFAWNGIGVSTCLPVGVCGCGQRTKMREPFPCILVEGNLRIKSRWQAGLDDRWDEEIINGLMD